MSMAVKVVYHRHRRCAAKHCTAALKMLHTSADILCCKIVAILF